jgi:hypothetical protein
MQTVRALTAQQAQNAGIRGVAQSGNSNAPAVEITANYPYQSYFDSTLLQNAILRQAPNEQIVGTTKETSTLSGYALGLHPSSETPIAVQFKSGEQQGGSAVFRIKPGEVIRPYGTPDGVGGRFSGFDFGLPFGWLGGGNATLVVFRTADSTVDWIDRSELIFHRQRMQILAPASVPTTPAKNWPNQVPWLYAASGASQLTQRGTPALVVTPTRTVMSLRGDLAVTGTMRVYLIGTDEFAEGANGVANLTEALGYDVTWGTWTSLGSANFAAQFQYQFLPPEMFRVNANGGGLILVDTGSNLAGLYVDVVRYGVL